MQKSKIASKLIRYYIYDSYFRSQCDLCIKDCSEKNLYEKYSDSFFIRFISDYTDLPQNRFYLDSFLDGIRSDLNNILVSAYFFQTGVRARKLHQSNSRFWVLKMNTDKISAKLIHYYLTDQLFENNCQEAISYNSQTRSCYCSSLSFGWILLQYKDLKLSFLIQLDSFLEGLNTDNPNLTGYDLEFYAAGVKARNLKIKCYQ